MNLAVMKLAKATACAIFSLDNLRPIPMASDVFVNKSLWGLDTLNIGQYEKTG